MKWNPYEKIILMLYKEESLSKTVSMMDNVVPQREGSTPELYAAFFLVKQKLDELSEMEFQNLCLNDAIIANEEDENE